MMMSTDTVCPVCWESVHGDEPVGVTTGCGHVWHQSCYRSWEHKQQQQQPTLENNISEICCLICHQPTRCFVDLFIRLPRFDSSLPLMRDRVQQLEREFHSVSRRTQRSLEQELARRDLEGKWIHEEQSLHAMSRHKEQLRHEHAMLHLKQGLHRVKRAYQRKVAQMEQRQNRAKNSTTRRRSQRRRFRATTNRILRRRSRSNSSSNHSRALSSDSDTAALPAVSENRRLRHVLRVMLVSGRRHNTAARNTRRRGMVESSAESTSESDEEPSQEEDIESNSIENVSSQNSATTSLEVPATDSQAYDSHPPVQEVVDGSITQESQTEQDEHSSAVAALEVIPFLASINELEYIGSTTDFGIQESNNTNNQHVGQHMTEHFPQEETACFTHDSDGESNREIYQKRAVLSTPSGATEDRSRQSRIRPTELSSIAESMASCANEGDQSISRGNDACKGSHDDQEDAHFADLFTAEECSWPPKSYPDSDKVATSSPPPAAARAVDNSHDDDHEWDGHEEHDDRNEGKNYGKLKIPDDETTTTTEDEDHQWWTPQDHHETQNCPATARKLSISNLTSMMMTIDPAMLESADRIEEERLRVQVETERQQQVAERLERERQEAEMEIAQEELALVRREQLLRQERTRLEESFHSIQRREQETQQDSRDRQRLKDLERQFGRYKQARSKEETRYQLDLQLFDQEEIYIQDRREREEARQEKEKIRLREELNEVISIMTQLQQEKQRVKETEDHSISSQNCNETCVVCMEPLAHETSDFGVAVPCGHCFHFQCFRGWEKSIRRRADDVKCPLCNLPTKLCVAIRLNLPGCSLYGQSISLSKGLLPAKHDEPSLRRRRQFSIDAIPSEMSDTPLLD